MKNRRICKCVHPQDSGNAAPYCCSEMLTKNCWVQMDLQLWPTPPPRANVEPALPSQNIFTFL